MADDDHPRIAISLRRQNNKINTILFTSEIGSHILCVIKIEPVLGISNAHPVSSHTPTSSSGRSSNG